MEDKSIICKKKYLKEKGAQPSINENKNHYELQKRSWVEGLRECHMKSKSKKNTTKKNWAEEAKETARKSSTQGRKVLLKKTNHDKELRKKNKKTKKKP